MSISVICWANSSPVVIRSARSPRQERWKVSHSWVRLVSVTTSMTAAGGALIARAASTCLA